jgi:ABC-type branched-subunit amino acid transport system substrate-binding protein
MQRVKVGLVAGIIAAVGLSVMPAANAAAKAGAKCTKVGATEANLVCQKVGSATRWVKAAAAPASTAAPVTTAAPAPAATTPAAAPAASSALPTGGDAPGVDASSIKIGFITVGARGGPASTTAVADEAKSVQAIVDWANAQGGVAGRKIVPTIKDMNIIGNVIAQSAAICASLTEDTKVFAVVLIGHAFAADRECYAKKKTLVLDPSNFPMEKSLFDRLSPFFINTTNPDIDRVAIAMVREAKSKDWFGKEPKIGVFTYDTPENKRVVNETLAADLKAVGFSIADVGYSGTDSPQTFFKDAATAAARFQAKGIDHVIMMGSGGLGPVFALAAEAQKFFPRYLLHSFETPRYLADIPSGPGTQPLQKGTLRGALAIGFTPYQDTEDIQNPFPNPGIETTCTEAYRVKGVFFTSRNSARYALGYCDGIMWLLNASKGLKDNLTIQSVVANAENIGTMTLPGSYKLKFSKTQHDGGSGYYLLKFDETCTRIGDNRTTSTGCWVRDGALKTFG